MDEESSWDLQIPTLLLAYRTSIHDTTGATPFELMFGKEPRVPEDVIYSTPASTNTTPEQNAGQIVQGLQASKITFKTSAKSSERSKSQRKAICRW